VGGMIKLIWRYLTFGIGWGSFIFVAQILLWLLTNPDSTQLVLDNPLNYVVGYLALGIGFFGTGIVYEIDRIGFALKLVIHIFVGIGVFLLVSFGLNWGIIETPIVLMANVIGSIVIIFIGWVVLYLRDKKDVENINKVLEKQNQEKTLDTE